MTIASNQVHVYRAYNKSQAERLGQTKLFKKMKAPTTISFRRKKIYMKQSEKIEYDF